ISSQVFVPTSHLLDPGVVGGPIFEKTSGSILMSGTLFPPSMYSDILGIPENRADGVEYKSGFPPENRPILIANDVTSKFSERESSYSTIRDHISSVLEKTPGNIAIFAPSYAMMDRIDSDISYSFGKRIERESRGMPKNLVERMINRLYERKSMGGGTALLGVLRGKFSEGIDYSENVLDAVVCVGLPLPPPSARQEALLEYYTKRFRSRSKAWKYASLQPAVNSVLQALGRPIRKAEDKAIIILLEKRLLERKSKDCMPIKSMQIMTSSSPSRTSKLVERFFEMN
ncbi:MAG: helicase C-terminal domain-containing protein, partial [Candidatus Poseidoniia archaeon]